MNHRVAVLALLLFISVSCSSSRKLARPHKTAQSNSGSVAELIREGVQLHDEGRYEEAIARYEKALQINSDNPLALYEMSYAYFALRQHEMSLEYGLRAAEYQSDFLMAIYTVVASDYDILGKPYEALKIYDMALEVQPGHYLTLFNKGITYTGLGKREQAISYFKAAVRANPGHASSHLALAEQYLADNYRVPCLLAYCRFLLLEPDTRRAGETLMKLQQVMNSGVSKEGEKQITISLPETLPDYDGDFRSIELMLSMTGAVRQAGENQDQHPIEQLASALNSVFTMLREVNEEPQKGFVWKYYAPYFSEMARKEYTQVFTYVIFQLADDEVIQNWLEAHPDEIKTLYSWSEKHQFPAEL